MLFQQQQVSLFSGSIFPTIDHDDAIDPRLPLAEMRVRNNFPTMGWSSLRTRFYWLFLLPSELGIQAAPPLLSSPPPPRSLPTSINPNPTPIGHLPLPLLSLSSLPTMFAVRPSALRSVFPSISRTIATSSVLPQDAADGHLNARGLSAAEEKVEFVASSWSSRRTKASWLTCVWVSVQFICVLEDVSILAVSRSAIWISSVSLLLVKRPLRPLPLFSKLIFFLSPHFSFDFLAESYRTPTVSLGSSAEDLLVTLLSESSTDASVLSFHPVSPSR